MLRFLEGTCTTDSLYYFRVSLLEDPSTGLCLHFEGPGGVWCHGQGLRGFSDGGRPLASRRLGGMFRHLTRRDMGVLGWEPVGSNAFADEGGKERGGLSCWRGWRRVDGTCVYAFFQARGWMDYWLFARQGYTIFCDVCVQYIGTCTSAPKVVTGPGYQARTYVL